MLNLPITLELTLYTSTSSGYHETVSRSMTDIKHHVATGYEPYKKEPNGSSSSLCMASESRSSPPPIERMSVDETNQYSFHKRSR